MIILFFIWNFLKIINHLKSILYCYVSKERDVGKFPIKELFSFLHLFHFIISFKINLILCKYQIFIDINSRMINRINVSMIIQFKKIP